MISVAIFDIDGTLLDSVDLHARAWQDAFAYFGHRFEFGDIRAQIGKGGDQLLPVFLSPSQVADIGDKLQEYRGSLFKERYLQQVKPFPDVPPLIGRLKAAGIKVSLASSAKGDEIDAYVRIAGIEGMVDAATSSDDAERSKPHPDIFAATLKRLGDPPADSVIALGDTPYDAQAAGKFGVRTIGMLCGGFAEADLRKAGCIAIYRDPADLLQNFDTSPFIKQPAQL